jgi:very-short-patch-repair endonuclease
MDVVYHREYRFSKCKNLQPLPFDFYIPSHNLCIEYDGEQHTIAYEYFGGDDKLKQTKQNDELKTSFCIANNIKLIRIPYTEYINIETILNNVLL